MKRMLALLAAFAMSKCGYAAAAPVSNTISSFPASAIVGSRSLWRILDEEPVAKAWKIIFGKDGERGEYMDGYTKEDMLQRCTEDYKWTPSIFPKDQLCAERAKMMSHLYDNERLWEYVSMVAFAEHYVLPDEAEDEAASMGRPFETFQTHKVLQSVQGDRPIFSGVILRDWESDESSVEQKLKEFQLKGIDYVRFECNFGSARDIDSPSHIATNPNFSQRFEKLAGGAKACQDMEMVPLVLIQVPWRDRDSNNYFTSAIQCFSEAIQGAGVESRCMLLETRPPIAVSAQEEKKMRNSRRTSVGIEAGHTIFESIESAFDHPIAGFCVAGGSTKGNFPTAMEDDTQNAVRQGIRNYAKERWGYELCYWEMGAKLMLQPRIGQLWKDGQTGADEARDLFRINAQNMGEQIKMALP